MRHGEPPGCGKWNCVLCNALPQTADLVRVMASILNDLHGPSWCWECGFRRGHREGCRVAEALAHIGRSEVSDAR